MCQAVSQFLWLSHTSSHGPPFLAAAKSHYHAIRSSLSDFHISAAATLFLLVSLQRKSFRQNGTEPCGYCDWKYAELKVPEGSLQVPCTGLSDETFVIQNCCPWGERKADLSSKDAIIVILSHFYHQNWAEASVRELFSLTYFSSHLDEVSSPRLTLSSHAAWCTAKSVEDNICHWCISIQIMQTWVRFCNT